MNETFCPVAEASSIVGRKWVIIVIHNLLEEPLGFNELKKRISGISSKTLSMSLSYLTETQIIDRTVHSNSPIRVEYRLTEKGLDMKNMLDEMKQWSSRWLAPKKAL